MDLSKLPRLSESDKQGPAPPPATPLPHAEPIDHRARQSMLEDRGPQIWLSAILGIVFMMMGHSFARFLFAKLTGQTFHTGVNWTAGPKAGQEVEYYELLGYTGYTDTGVFLFGFAMVLEAIVLAIVKRSTPATRALAMLMLLLTAGMTLFNLGLALFLFSKNVMPITSLLAAAFGGYMVHWQWKLLRELSVGRA